MPAAGICPAELPLGAVSFTQPILEISAVSARPEIHTFRHAFCVPDSHTLWRNPTSGFKSDSNARKSAA